MCTYQPAKWCYLWESDIIHRNTEKGKQYFVLVTFNLQIKSFSGGCKHQLNSLEKHIFLEPCIYVIHIACFYYYCLPFIFHISLQLTIHNNPK